LLLHRHGPAHVGAGGAYLQGGWTRSGGVVFLNTTVPD
jgi:hypothetical protein